MKYLITQTRKDAIGIVQQNLLKRLNYKQINIKWFKFMPLSHLWELVYTFLFSFRLKATDIVLSCNSKSIHTHILPLLTKAKLFQIHYHFDDKRLFKLHHLSCFSYEKLFSQWHTIFTNTHMKELAVAGLGCKNWSVVPLGIDHEMFQDYGLTREPNTLLYVGSFGHRKNITRTIQAFSNILKVVPTAQLTICNGGSGSYQDIELQLNTLGIQDKVNYLKDVSLVRLVTEYNKAEVFVFPTLIEGFGLPLVEATACGCRVVTSNLPVHREVTCNKETYVDPLKVNAIAEGMIKALKRKGNNKEVSHKFNWNRMATDVLEITND